MLSRTVLVCIIFPALLFSFPVQAASTCNPNESCYRCLVSLFGKCMQMGNDPVCEARKAVCRLPPPTAKIPGTPESPLSLTGKPEPGKSSFQIEFLGSNFPDDWAGVANTLLEKNLVSRKQTSLLPGEGSCAAVLRALNFTTNGIGCSDAMQALVNKLNPSLGKVIPDGTEITYPDLPIEPLTWNMKFDLPDERDRFDKVAEVWAKARLGETNVRGSQVQLRFKGFETNIQIAPDAVETLRSIEHFQDDIKRQSIRVVPNTDEPIAKSPNSNSPLSTPMGWYSQCLKEGAPALPKPSYATMLGMAAGRPCPCTENNCPQIVLLDTEINVHPDIADALGVKLPTVSEDSNRACPYVRFEKKLHHHATHLAGIMVGANHPASFPGIAAGVHLKPLNYDEMKGPLGAKQIKETINDNRNSIFVFASKFNNIENKLIPKDKPEQRYDDPKWIYDITESFDLWVVAAGQRERIVNEQEEIVVNEKDIGKTNPDSPMNLGDADNIIVVTACENCLTDDAWISDWANYSTAGLVNVAAPGGTAAESIPGPASATEYGLAWGTSQATAFVGGLAAKMVACYPMNYKYGQDIKHRLQATSRPFMRPHERGKLSAGMVDAEAALLDPNVHWVTLKGKMPRKAVQLQWCREDVTLESPDGEEVLASFKSKRINQILKKSDGNQPVWYFVRELGQKQQKDPLARVAKAEVVTHGPAILADNPALMKVTFDDGSVSRVLHMEDIDQLIVGMLPNRNLSNIVSSCS